MVLNRLLRKGFLVPILILLMLCCYALPAFKETKAADKIGLVVVSVAPYKGLIEALSDGCLQVEVLIPAGADPHTHEPSPWEIKRLMEADLWIHVGGYMTKLQQVVDIKDGKYSRGAGAGPETIDLYERLGLAKRDYSLDRKELSCHHHNGSDPHIWLSPALLRQQLPWILELLVSHFPQEADCFRNNGIAMDNYLAQMELIWAQLAKKTERKAVLVSHPAFGYLCSELSIKQLSLEGASGELGPKALCKLVDQIKNYGIDQIFLDKGHASKAATYLIQELALSPSLLDPYAEDVIANLSLMARLLAGVGNE